MAKRFHQNEEGAATVFGVFTLILMMFAGGIAIDIMRSEADRSRLQNAIDRSVLAAAQLDQERDATVVVKDYLRAAGIDEDRVNVRPVIVLNETNGKETSKQVSVKANSEVDSFFMNAFGIDQLVQPISTQALEEESRVEIALVLDISGSMKGTKSDNLKTAGKKFVETMIGDRPDLTSISVVSYDSQVNLGETVAGYFPMSDEHELSHCVSFGDDDYETTVLDSEVQRLGHFDRVSKFNIDYYDSNSRGPVPDAQGSCPPGDVDGVLPWSNNVAALTAHIDSMSAAGSTAVGKGVKVGAWFLDPTTQNILEAMADDGLVDEEFRGGPVNYGTEGYKKVMVVMTDGKNTNQFDLRDDVRDGLSRLWVYHPPNSNADLTTSVHYDINENGEVELGELVHTNFDGHFKQDEPDETQYSFWSPDREQYWLPHKRKYVDEPAGGDDAVQMTNVEVFNSMSSVYIVQTLLRNKKEDKRADYADREWWWNATEHTHVRDVLDPVTGLSRGDEDLREICEKVRGRGIEVFSIALEAGDVGEAAMRDCADVEEADVGNKHYYKVVKASDLGQTFDDIAASINRLKLTQ